jgi:hypothetical protein
MWWNDECVLVWTHTKWVRIPLRAIPRRHKSPSYYSSVRVLVWAETRLFVGFGGHAPRAFDQLISAYSA